MDETEKGWYVQYIDRDPAALQRQKELEKKEKMDMDDQERQEKFLKLQIERAAATLPEKPVAEATELQRSSEEDKVVFAMPALPTKKPDDAKPSTR